MRVIEKQMNDAITASKDWKKDNTEVVTCSHVSDVFLYGNLIARIGETWIELFDGGINQQPQSLASMLFSLLMVATMSMSFRRKVSGFLTIKEHRFLSSLVCV